MISDPTTLTIGGNKAVRKTDDRIMQNYQKFESAKEAQSRERNREFENLKLYAGHDNSMWPKTIQDFMMREGRGTQYDDFTHYGQYNFIKTKINGIAGSLVRNPFDASYVADESSDAPLTLALQQVYMSDKELMDWDANASMCYILGLSYVGVLRMYVKTAHPASPMGNVALECMPSGTTMIDPDWISGRSKDMNNIWTFAYMTVEDMKQKYNAKKEIIETELDILKRFGGRYEKTDLEWNKSLPQSHADKWLVVQRDYLQREKITRQFDPVSMTTLWEWMDDNTKERIIENNNVDRSALRDIEIYDNVHNVFTFCPGLSLSQSLLDIKAEFQLGRLPYFPWCPEWMNGKPLPMLDQLRDPQMEVNKRTATISLAAETSVTSGIMVDEAIFGMDEQKKDDFERNRTNPKYTGWMKPGTSRAFPNAIQEVIKQQVPNDLFNITNMMIDMMDRLVPQPAASEARTDKGESGVLFAQKIEVAKTLQQTLLESVRQLWNDIGESYFFLAKQLYSKGRRTFTDAKGSFKITLNDTKVDEFGEITTMNDFVALPRHRVVISEQPAGVNNRLTQRELNNALAQNYAQIAPNASMTFISNLVDSVDMDSVKKEEAMEAVELDRQRIRAETEAAIANAKIAQQTAEQQAQQPGLDPQMALPSPGAENVIGGLNVPPGGQPPPPELVGG